MKYLAILAENGWMEHQLDFADYDQFQENLLCFACQFGEPVKSRPTSALTEKLRPLSTENAKPASLSRKFGLGVFPFHSDCAHWTKPPRYVVLAASDNDESLTSTFLLNVSDISLSAVEQRAIRESLFLTSNGRNSFYCTIQEMDSQYWRFDPECMKPQNDAAHFAVEIFSFNRNVDHATEIGWNRGKIVVIDNWKSLHARAPLPSAASNREIWRVLVQ